LTIDSPVHLDEEQKVRPRRAPELGEHTEQILREVGLDTTAIERLRAGGAIPATSVTRRAA
jgi:formyl-CoA transferase